MRLDKFLKVSRIIKRLTVANEACGGERVTVNGVVRKPSHRVKPGDIIGVRFGDRELRVEIVEIAEHASKADAGSLYKELPSSETIQSTTEA